MMSTSAEVLYDLLTEVHRELLRAEGEIQRDTEHLRDELGRLLAEVDTLLTKLKVEAALMKDKQALEDK